MRLTEQMVLGRFQQYIKDRKELDRIPETMVQDRVTYEERCRVNGEWLSLLGVDLSATALCPFLAGKTDPQTIPWVYHDLWLYVPEEHLLIHAEEGTGDNLLREDQAEGYVDEVEYTTYCLTDELTEQLGRILSKTSDGGCWMLKEPFREKYHSMDGCIPDLLEAVCDNRTLSCVSVPDALAKDWFAYLRE